MASNGWTYKHKNAFYEKRLRKDFEAPLIDEFEVVLPEGKGLREELVGVLLGTSYVRYKFKIKQIGLRKHFLSKGAISSRSPAKCISENLGSEYDYKRASNIETLVGMSPHNQSTRIYCGVVRLCNGYKFKHINNNVLDSD
ncbi:23392_t:CDS:2 [Gigaspora margarita]|uniref:23392_t:CDS:1 n=1 Tax=Gigaspora margarita TaxID=4874 RepID=A0ABN7VE59_GIGMA|nr:23392_t:CDS:2 [Gigaspora margarita]